MRMLQLPSLWLLGNALILFQLVVKEDEYFNNNVRDLRYVMTRNMDKYRKAPDLTRSVRRLCPTVRVTRAGTGIV